MTGKKHRPRRLGEASRTWNIMFPISVLERVQKQADETSITSASLVRTAVDLYLSGGTIRTAMTAKDGEFIRGVHEAVATLRALVTQPRYPAGHTLGDVLADKIIAKIESDYAAARRTERPKTEGETALANCIEAAEPWPNVATSNAIPDDPEHTT